MQNGTAAGGVAPTAGGRARAVRWAIAARQIGFPLRTVTLAATCWLRWVAVPAVCALAQTAYERLAPRARAIAARGQRTWVQAMRTPELPVYAVALLVAVLLGWILGHGV